MKKTIRLHPRYYEFVTEPPLPSSEEYGRYVELDWSLPLEQVALVLVDVWDWHYLDDTRERNEEVVGEKIVPLVSACRAGGLRVIHAPADPVAAKYTGRQTEPPPPPAWPPAEFTRKEGAYRAYARPKGSRWPGILKHALTDRDFHPAVRPADGEAVIANGEELRAVLEKERILFLLYAGFHNNACIARRDYGLWAMRAAGYEGILVRDATTGMEAAFTRGTLEQTTQATLNIEMFGGASIESAEVIAALPDRA